LEKRTKKLVLVSGTLRLPVHLRPGATDKSFFEKLLFVGWREADDTAGYGTILALSFRSEAFYHEEAGDD